MAMFAILMNALAPTMSHAMAAWNGDAATWEICRTEATASASDDRDGLLVVGAAGKKITPSQMGMKQDCGYCAPHAGSHGLPPVLAALPAMGKAHGLQPFLLYRSPQPLRALSPAAPRGPPAFA